MCLQLFFVFCRWLGEREYLVPDRTVELLGLLRSAGRVGEGDQVVLPTYGSSGGDAQRLAGLQESPRIVTPVRFIKIDGEKM